MNKIRRESARFFKGLAVSSGSLCPIFLLKAACRNWNRVMASFVSLTEREKAFRAPVIPGSEVLSCSYKAGFSEFLHPSVIYSDQPGIRYLMAMTPLPDNVEYFENPELLVSDDGISWKLPRNGLSPVIAAPEDWCGYNSDPFIFYLGTELSMLYRTVRETRCGNCVTIYLTSSSDLSHWSCPEAVLSEPSAGKYPIVFMSPAALRTEEGFLLWHITGRREQPSIIRVKGPELTKLEYPGESCRLPADLCPWHLEILKEPGSERLIMTLCAFRADSFSSKFITFLTSEDMGRSWTAGGRSLLPEELGVKSLYKASLLPAKETSGYYLYYSAQNWDDSWHSYRLTLPSIYS